MALDSLTYVYYAILFLVVTLSWVKKAIGIGSDFLNLNFTIIFGIECIVLFAKFLNQDNLTGLYFLLDLLNITYTYYFFQVHFKHNKLLLYYGLASIGLILIFNNYNISQYSDICSVVSCFYVIIVCLYGFYLVVESNRYENQKIQNIPFFWYGTAMLLWCLMYLFRTIPRFYFQDEDKEFMQNLRIFFASVNVVVYAIFFKLILMYKRR